MTAASMPARISGWSSTLLNPSGLLPSSSTISSFVSPHSSSFTGGTTAARQPWTGILGSRMAVAVVMLGSFLGAP